MILQTAGTIDFSGMNPNKVAILATGAQGGAGKGDLGGSFVTGSGKVETLPRLDACPPGYPTGAG